MAPKKSLADYAKEFYVGGGSIKVPMVDTLKEAYFKEWPGVKKALEGKDSRQSAKALRFSVDAYYEPMPPLPPTPLPAKPPAPPPCSPTTVYRVEHYLTGRGPYGVNQREKTEALRMALACHGCPRTPEPYSDSDRAEWAPWERPPWEEGRFGFLDMDCLRKWFTAYEWHLLYESGFRIFAYSTTDIQWLGKSGQLAFNPYASTRLVTYPIDYCDSEAKVYP